MAPKNRIDKHLKAALDAELETLDSLPPIERAVAAAEHVEFHRFAMNAVAMTRQKAIKAVLDEGTSAAQLAELLGVSRQRVYQLAEPIVFDRA